MHILDPQNGGPDFPEFLQQSVGDTVAIAGRQGSSEAVAHNCRQITKWASRSRGDQSVTMTDQQPRPGRGKRWKGPDEAALTDSCFAVYQHHGAGSVDSPSDCV